MNNMKLLQERRQHNSQSNFVMMQKSAGFYKWAWNIVVGCKNGCEYCYARRMVTANRKNFTDLRFYYDMLDEPKKVQNAMIFVNYLSDIMGEWVPSNWIEQIIDITAECPTNTFLWMTKNPRRYFEFKFPENSVLGITVESPKEWWRADVVKDLKARKMCSTEPILGDFTGYDFSQFEFVVVGALMTFDDKPPDKTYYDTVKHERIYYTR